MRGQYSVRIRGDNLITYNLLKDGGKLLRSRYGNGYTWRVLKDGSEAFVSPITANWLVGRKLVRIESDHGGVVMYGLIG